jgi:hypothetical protein
MYISNGGEWTLVSTLLLFRGLPLLFNAIFGGSPRISFAFSLTDSLTDR